MTLDYAAARTNMVESQVRVSDVTDLKIQDAMRATPREDLLPADKAYLAYADIEVEYAPGRWLLTPRHLAKLLQAVRPRAGEKALAIAAPYAAAVMAAMGVEVTRLDGEDLRAVAGVYDIIVCEGAISPPAPIAWTGALAPGGRLGVVERNGRTGHATLYRRTEQGVGAKPLFDCAAPILAGFEGARGFSF